MYCQECGTKAADNTKFCAECGRKLPSATDIEERPKQMYSFKTAITDYFKGMISESKLRDMVRKKQIPHVKMGNRTLFSGEALDAWMEEQERISTGKQNPLKLVR